MDINKAKKRIEVLKKEIDRNRYLYHVLDKPRVSDAVDDSLKHELKSLEDKFPSLVTFDSPSQRVGGKPLDKFKKVIHKTPMFSLNDVFDFGELKAWEQRLVRLVRRSEIEKSGYYCELKMDGLAVSLKYEEGQFVQGSTRGDGRVGEDVTNNLRTIESIPLRLREGVKGGVVARGEIYITKEEFNKLNKKQAEQNAQLYANPRNIAAGSIRQLDPKISRLRNLKFMLYGLSGFDFSTHQSEHEKGEALGFKANVQNNKFCQTIEEVYKYYQHWEKRRDSLSYQIDGVVVGINNKKLFLKLGVAGKAPRGQVAMKFPAKEATSTVRDIIVQVGRTGKLTPVAVLEPTLVAGSTVSRATLHNQDEIERKDIRIGDTVIIRKAGDVIPEVIEPIKRMRTGNEKIFKMPKKCPICGGPVLKKSGEVDWYCKDKNCSVRQYRGIIHFVSKNAFNIDGLGPQIIKQLIDSGLIRNVAEIFQLKEGDLKPLARFAEKSVANLIEAINKSKQIALDRFIYSLGIRHVGDQTAVDLAKHFRSLDEFIRAKKEEIGGVYGIGDGVAQSLISYLADEANINLINNLQKHGVKVSDFYSAVKKNLLGGKSFVVTGTLESLTRNDAHKKIIQFGGKIHSSVTPKTDYLVVGEEPGSKLKKAKKYRTKIISEKEFLNMIK